jgi:hypothetical protein
MAKQSAAKSAADNPARGVHAASTSPAARAVKRAEPRAPQTAARPSSLLDTRVVYCGDNLEQLAKLPDGPCRTGQHWGRTREKRSCNSALRTPHSAIALAGSFYYHCDWHASHNYDIPTPL